MKQLYFATGNSEKMIDASMICEKYNIELIQKLIDIDEIQHHDPLKITEAKARAAYAAANAPVVVNDSSWEIPSLGGFPGGYMKDINQWFTPEDFLNLMRDKSDRSIVLHEAVAYYDGKSYQVFTADRSGKFLDKPSAEPGSSLASLVSMDADNGLTINQVFSLRRAGKYNPVHDNYQHWIKFAEWYAEHHK